MKLIQKIMYQNSDSFVFCLVYRYTLTTQSGHKKFRTK